MSETAAAAAFREGWTERIVYVLKSDESVLNLTGFTVALVGNRTNRDHTLGAIGFTGSVGVVSAVAGTVYFDPAPTDLVAAYSPYRVRWEVTDGAGKKAYFPRDGALVWEVQKP